MGVILKKIERGIFLNFLGFRNATPIVYFLFFNVLFFYFFTFFICLIRFLSSRIENTSCSRAYPHAIPRHVFADRNKSITMRDQVTPFWARFYSSNMEGKEPFFSQVTICVQNRWFHLIRAQQKQVLNLRAVIVSVLRAARTAPRASLFLALCLFNRLKFSAQHFTLDSGGAHIIFMAENRAFYCREIFLFSPSQRTLSPKRSLFMLNAGKPPCNATFSPFTPVSWNGYFMIHWCHWQFYTQYESCFYVVHDLSTISSVLIKQKLSRTPYTGPIRNIRILVTDICYLYFFFITCT